MTSQVALVGYGSAGRGIHAPLLAAAGMGPHLVVTANPQRVAQAAAELPDARVVPDLDAALAAGPDLVVLASPSGVHAEQVVACVAAGVPVVVDKPLAVDGLQAGEVTRAAAAAGVPLTVFQNRRWDTENLTLARLLRDGVLGEVHRFERRWERWRPVPKERWRELASWQQGGGILLDLHTHLVDAAVRLFGPVEQVYAEVAAWTTPAEDEAFLALRHAGGTTSHLTASSVAAAPGPRTRVLGGVAAYVVTGFESEPVAFGGFDDLPGHCGWLVRGEQREPVPAADGGHGDFYPAVRAALAEPDPLARQAAMPVDPADAVHVLDVLDAARRSAATSGVVRLGIPVAGRQAAG
ncbi:MAG TPA: Gfo/Idh/MocA family oxidoreductase [Kineosporiaceae bacterium]|nr:Gfo/Idh/MocA family oxidoreductase [Kineosporiaceae bacterium]